MSHGHAKTYASGRAHRVRRRAHRLSRLCNMDLPPFGDSPGQRRRAINLGGSTSQTTQSALLQEARARRQQRNDLKRKQDSATKIQSWWRGRQQARFVREQMRALFQDNVTNITGLRCVVLIGSDVLVLAKWSSAMLADGGGTC